MPDDDEEIAPGEGASISDAEMVERLRALIDLAEARGEDSIVERLKGALNELEDEIRASPDRRH